MSKKKNAVLLFAKYPRPGKVKTRLSVLKDGIFTPEDTSELFEAMLLDVCDIILAAFDELEEAYGDEEFLLYISTAPKSDLGDMKDLIGQSTGHDERVFFLSDSGRTFDEHYNDAFDQVWGQGIDRILSMGADMPALRVSDVVFGMKALVDIPQGEGVVISPDQAMGVSMIGWPRSTEFDHTGVFYNEEGLTVLPAYIEKARELEVPAYLIPAVVDVDTISDLAHSITLLQAADYVSRFDGSLPARRTIAKLEELGAFEVRVPPNELRDSREEIDSID